MARKKQTKPVSTTEKADAGKAAGNAGDPTREPEAPAQVANVEHAEPAGRQVRVAGLCASAGGLDAFKKFFSAMSSDSGVAFVLLPHLDPNHESLMVELIARQTAMPVVEATDGMAVAANHVYIIPPNKYITIAGGVLRLTGPVERWSTSFDVFLRSLADDVQERAICVILSGTGSHGVLGLKAVKVAGGLVMVQEPATAEYAPMPQNAVDTGLADIVLPPENLPAALLRYVQHFPADGPSALDEGDQLQHLLKLLRLRTKFDFQWYRKRMLLRRVERRMGLMQIHRLADYLDFLREHPDEAQRLSRDLLISVTSFFRDPEAWYALQSQAIAPLVQARDPEAPIRVWVPGSATGEEPYGVGILMLEQLSALHKSCPVQVFATDVDERAVEFGRQGIYPDSIRTDVAAERLGRFFTRINEQSYQVNKQLRDAVVFAVQNLIVDAPFSRLDLISCRNLFIYLEPDIQKKVLALFHYALNDGGYLFLGPSETIGRSADLFEPVDKKWRIYRRIGVGRPDRVNFPIVASDRPRGEGRTPVATLAGRPVNFGELAQQQLLEAYAPASVLIDRNHQVLYFFGSTARYLDQPTGEPTHDLLVLVREGLRAKVRTAVNRASRDNQPVNERGAWLKNNGSSVAVSITVGPLRGPRVPEGLLLVTFEDEGPAPPAGLAPPTAADEEPLVRQLENELHATREDLQSTVADLESSNEELKAANEEVMSMNEELQSANEELETSKEELQSLNEELSTVNSQLQDKVEELEQANNDMTNLLNCIDVATVFLDTRLRIKRFTHSATQLFSLIATDVGRPLDDITRKFADADLRADMEEVLRSLRPREKEIATDQGTCFFRRVVPYQTADRNIEGVVITFVDLSGPKQAERALRDSEQRLRGLNESLEERVAERTRELRESEEHMRSILDSAAEGIITVDETGALLSFNKAAERMFGYAAAEATGQNVNVLMPMLAPAERDGPMTNYLSAAERTLIGTTREVLGRRKDGSTFPVDLAVSELKEGNRRLFTGILRDISERRALEKEILEIAAGEQQRIGQDLHDSVGQEMTGLRLMAENLAASLTDPADKKRAQRIGAGLQETLQQIRGLSRGLIPVEVSPHGLMTALTDLAERVSDQSGVVCTFRCERPVLLKDPPAAAQLFRIAQEAITNALLHGRARNILLQLTGGGGALLTLTVEDDGRGIPARALPSKGSGLKIMNYRARLINAVLEVGPGAKGGTRVTCTLKIGKNHDQKTKPAKKRQGKHSAR